MNKIRATSNDFGLDICCYDMILSDLKKILIVNRYSLQSYYFKKLSIYLHEFLIVLHRFYIGLSTQGENHFTPPLYRAKVYNCTRSIIVLFHVPFSIFHAIKFYMWNLYGRVQL